MIHEVVDEFGTAEAFIGHAGSDNFAIITQEELAAAKSGWLQSRKVSRSSDNGVAGTLNQYLYMDRTLAWDADFEKKVENLTLDQVNAAMKKYLDYSKMIIVKAGDFKKAKP